MIDLTNAVNRKDKNFNKQQRGKGLPLNLAKFFDCTKVKIVSSKQILQRLPVALEQVQTGSTSRGLLNEIRQIK